MNSNSISSSSVTKSGQEKLQPRWALSLNTHTTFLSQVEPRDHEPLESRDCVEFSTPSHAPCKERNSTNVCWPWLSFCVPADSLHKPSPSWNYGHQTPLSQTSMPVTVIPSPRSHNTALSFCQEMPHNSQIDPWQGTKCNPLEVHII